MYEICICKAWQVKSTTYSITPTTGTCCCLVWISCCSSAASSALCVPWSCQPICSLKVWGYTLRTGLRDYSAAPNKLLYPEICGQSRSAKVCFPSISLDAPGEGLTGSLVQMLSGLMWAPQIEPSLSGVFAIESSEVMKAHVNYALCSSYELMAVFLAAVISWLLKIPDCQRASREFAVRVSRRGGEMCWCVWQPWTRDGMPPGDGPL